MGAIAIIFRLYMASKRWEPAAERRPLVLLGVPSALGISLYEDGTPRGVARSPAVLRQHGLVPALLAKDAGDLCPAPYRDFTKPAGRPRNDAEVADLTEALAERVAQIRKRGEFPVVIGGECSVVLGALAGLRRSGIARPGLVYLDGHADFATPEESRSGSVASMCLGLAVGRAPAALKPLALDPPLVRPEDVALVGRRDEAEPWYGHNALRKSDVLDLPDAAVHGAGGYEAVLEPVLARVASTSVGGFWIHVDADVLPGDLMPAVDSPAPGGPRLDELAAFIRTLSGHPKAAGIELTIYDPQLDPTGICARRLVTLLAEGLSALSNFRP